MVKLKPGIRVIKKKDLFYQVESGNRLMQFKPWLGDSFSFMYDFIMRNSVFPRKFGSNIQKHNEILKQELGSISKKQILELATGSGSAIHFLDNNNHYTGTDISPELLRLAAKQFRKSGFTEAEFYVASAENLPFEDGIFDLCLCILSLNFFNNAEMVFKEIKRVLVTGGMLVCCVPVPERNSLNSTIRGILYSESELKKICEKHGFRFGDISSENGALLYFKARKSS